MIGLGTLTHYASKGGWKGRLDDTSAAETFKGEAVEKLLAETAAPRSPPGPRGGSRFRLIFPPEMRALPEPSYTVDTLVPDQGVTLIYGAPGSLKTFLVLDILASIAGGVPAFGRYRTQQGTTVLCAGEAPFAVARRRWPAFADARGIARPDDVPFAIVAGVPAVSSPSDVDALVEAIAGSGHRPRAIAIDTVARAVGGMDENDARAAGLMIAVAERLRDEFGSAVLLIHHSGKDETRGARGSSALSAGADAIFRVTRAKDTLAVTLHCEKMKDADEPGDVHLQGEETGGSLSFHVVTADEHAAATRANPPLAPAEVGKALHRAGAVNGVNVNTRQLAASLVEPAADEKALANMERRLRRAATGALAAYLAEPASGRGSTLQWTFPTVAE